ncbi:hypothetical protein D8B26_006873 [Coccidioides posadasii str. Silveira]|uniref:uncharacterized protein n=1 Tax=Coccidioides posadasii (strain RMSCC 757 / Silveira) TaxID=443226 RepID=UPI001BEFFBE4|nr:hypothetical protein D8B26_006873 [Coccidioides posadasii str. Silveira]
MFLCLASSMQHSSRRYNHFMLVGIILHSVQSYAKFSEIPPFKQMLEVTWGGNGFMEDRRVQKENFSEAHGKASFLYLFFSTLAKVFLYLGKGSRRDFNP